MFYKLTFLFCLDIIVLLPFRIPIFFPRRLFDTIREILIATRVISQKHGSENVQEKPLKTFVRFRFPINFITMPLIADLFLLAIAAIGRREVYEGTIGADNIAPYDVLLVFLCLGYIAGSLEASGLIRWLAFKVMVRARGVGHRLFFNLYTSFFGLGILIGNDPIMVSFVAYMTRISSNILHPRAWIHAQFAVANIATAILVTSNPTNLVLAGAFNIKFVNYTANLIVPVLCTAIALFPFLLYIVFGAQELVPVSIEMHSLPHESQARLPVNPNISGGGDLLTKEGDEARGQSWALALDDVLNPFLNKRHAFFGTVVMAATIVILLVLNAVYLSGGGHPDYWVTLPAALVVFSKDILDGWHNRHQTRENFRSRREEVQRFRAEEARKEELNKREELKRQQGQELNHNICSPARIHLTSTQIQGSSGSGSYNNKIIKPDDETISLNGTTPCVPAVSNPPSPTMMGCMLKRGDSLSFVMNNHPHPSVVMLIPGGYKSQKDKTFDEEMDDRGKKQITDTISSTNSKPKNSTGVSESQGLSNVDSGPDDDEKRGNLKDELNRLARGRTLQSLVLAAYEWSHDTFPTAAEALGHLPFALVPFTLSMFVLVQALVSTGWVPIFAHGWSLWVDKTGTVGSIASMGLLSVILCNVSFHRYFISRYWLTDLSRLVCWHEYWYYHPTFTSYLSMEEYGAQERDQRQMFLGNVIQHGTRCQLWSIQLGF
jgi:Na+/H+ antiporter NhaD/arsenite permease-like protein